MRLRSLALTVSAGTADLILTAATVAAAVSFLAWTVASRVRHSRKMRRMEAYGRWVERMGSSPDPEERMLAAVHAHRILLEGPEGGYEGPWCE